MLGLTMLQTMMTIFFDKQNQYNTLNHNSCELPYNTTTKRKDNTSATSNSLMYFNLKKK